MPKSKRDKTVSLTKVKPKGMEKKKELVAAIRAAVDEYKHLFAFSVQNMRSSKLNDVRQEFKFDSRLFFGKTSVMRLALGRIPEEECKEALHKVSRRLSGEAGLLFTNRSPVAVRKYLAELAATDFARSGNVAPSTVTLPAGALPQFSHAVEPQLRKLGLPTQLQKGVVTLLSEYTVCKADEPITPEQARLLKLLGEQLATFRVTLLCHWKGGKFKALQKAAKAGATKSSAAQDADKMIVE